ncbi:methyltransferase domain-containing protein [bacterium]|nr:methyltransferase domain-containing protein [bacterium]
MHLSRRHRVAEEMDDPRLGARRHMAALAGLGRINRVSLVARAIWPGIEEMARDEARPLRVLDIATGGGDLPRELLRIGRRRGIRIEAAGCDISEVALRYARERSPGVRFFKLDALDEPIPPGFDAVVCALFLHHLKDGDAVRLLRAMGEAARAVFVDDLSRDAIGLGLAWAGTRILSRSPIVHADGVRSVRAAFTVDEAARMARAAGLEGATIRRHWPRRWLLEWRRT